MMSTIYRKVRSWKSDKYRSTTILRSIDPVDNTGRDFGIALVIIANCLQFEQR